MRISGSGVAAKILDAGKPAAVGIQFTISLTAELGQRNIRLRTPGGISNRYRIMVGDFPEVNEVEPNSQPSQAQRLDTLPVLVNGRILEQDRDFFRFSARRGTDHRRRPAGPHLAPLYPRRRSRMARWVPGALRRRGKRTGAGRTITTSVPTPCCSLPFPKTASTFWKCATFSIAAATRLCTA